MLWIIQFRNNILHVSLLFYVLLEAKSAFALTRPRTGGNFLVGVDEKFYTANPFKSQLRKRKALCLMLFNTEARAQSMNIVLEHNSTLRCYFFENKASENQGSSGNLIKRFDSAYYEKIDNYLKAVSSVIRVGSKDNTPGTFRFQLPSGFYKIRLHHLKGGFLCHPSYQYHLPFGCYYGRSVGNRILLAKEVRGEILIPYNRFNKFEGDGMTTTYVATTDCFKLLENNTYSFWYNEDWSDVTEGNNSGESDFEMFVTLCED